MHATLKNECGEYDESIFIQIKAQEQLALCAVIILVLAELQCLPDTSDELFRTPVGLISHVHLESNTQETFG